LDLLRTVIKSKSDTFFAQFSPELNNLLVQKFKTQTLSRGDVFYSPGDNLPTCYIFVGKGQLRLIKNGQFTSTFQTGDIYAEDFIKFLIKRYKATKSDTEDEGWRLHSPRANDNTVTLESDAKNTIVLYLLLSDFINTLALFPAEQRQFFSNLDVIISKHAVTSLEMMEQVHVKQVSQFLRTEEDKPPRPKEKTGHKWVSWLVKLVQSFPLLDHLSKEEKKQVKEASLKLYHWAQKRGITGSTQL